MSETKEIQYPEKHHIKLLDKGFVSLVDSMGDDTSIVQAARVSYGKGTKKVSEDEGLIRYLLRHKHTTPFEMVQLKFHIRAPIFVFRQWHRHRMWSYNEMSGRYSEMPDMFYVPKKEHVTFQNPNNKQGGTDKIVTPLNLKNPDDWWEGVSAEQMAEDWDWSKIFEDEQAMVRTQYEKYIGTEMRKELARINLPLSQYSEMYATVDLHNLFHFLRLRMDSHAQYEIRVYADAMFEYVKQVVPIAAKAFEDYILNSSSLTHLEQQVMKALVTKLEYGSLWDSSSLAPKKFLAEQVSEVISTFISNKREREECLAKMKNIFTIEEE